MSEPIKAGDLVIVTGQHCGTENLGKIGTVDEICVSVSSYTCPRCGASSDDSIAAFVIGPRVCGWSRLQWLRKIDPPAEQADTETAKEMTV